MTLIPGYGGVLLMILPPGGFLVLGFLLAGKRVMRTARMAKRAGDAGARRTGCCLKERSHADRRCLFRTRPADLAEYRGAGRRRPCADAIERSGILKQFPHIDLTTQKVGVFGRLVKLDAALKPGDRIEIYRAIIATRRPCRARTWPTTTKFFNLPESSVCTACWSCSSCFPCPPSPPAICPTVGGIPVDFILFALTLLGVALFHHHTLYVALTGLVDDHALQDHLHRLQDRRRRGRSASAISAHEWVMLANLFCLLIGFALLAAPFREEPRAGDPAASSCRTTGRAASCCWSMVFVLSSFLDNIAAALIGGAMAHQLFKAQGAYRLPRRHRRGLQCRRLRVSVVGDTTTTMMWIDGISPADVFHAYVAAGVALLHHRLLRRQAAACLFADHQACPRAHQGRLGARRHCGADPGLRHRRQHRRSTCKFPDLADSFPFIGVAVWVAILLTVAGAPPDWELLPETFKGTDLPALAGDLRLDDAGREAAGRLLADRRWASASSRPCSTTSRSPRWRSSRAATTGASWPMPSASAAR